MVDFFDYVGIAADWASGRAFHSSPQIRSTRPGVHVQKLRHRVGSVQCADPGRVDVRY